MYIRPEIATTSALTRVVPLRSLLTQRAWSDRATLVANLRRYGGNGHEHGGYVEGILARLVEAADDCSELPSVADEGFLCGMEFASVEDERAHFARHSLRLDALEHSLHLAPGELLLLDNLTTAHGRVGVRAPQELHQLCVGYRGLDGSRQRALVARVLDAFGVADP